MKKLIFKTIKQQERFDQLLPNGVPKWIRCYDNGGPEKAKGTIDRYTVSFTKKAIINTRHDRWFIYLAMSESPFHPGGFGQHGESEFHPIDRPTYGHLGKKIKFEQLPKDCQRLVIQDYLKLWDLTDENDKSIN